jgi:hypothetical protein
MATNKEEFIEKLKAQLDDLNYHFNILRNKLEAKAQHISAEARETAETELDDLAKMRKQMKSKIIDIEVASENAWGDLKDGVETAWKSLSDALKKAGANFK